MFSFAGCRLRRKVPFASRRCPTNEWTTHGCFCSEEMARTAPAPGAPNIYIYNFYPTAKVDDDIELKKKAIMKLQAFHTVLGEDSQIYSETAEVDNFGLFERSPEEEERAQRLSLLMELRQFRQQNPEEFRRIKGLPLRARVGRAQPPRVGSTVTFIRSQRRDAFYRIRPGSSRREEAQTLTPSPPSEGERGGERRRLSHEPHRPCPATSPHQTTEEKQLWQAVKAGRFAGFKFRWQPRWAAIFWIAIARWRGWRWNWTAFNMVCRKESNATRSGRNFSRSRTLKWCAFGIISGIRTGEVYCWKSGTRGNGGRVA